MEIIAINEKNRNTFAERMGPDLTEDLDREFYRGLGALGDGDTPMGVLIYELKNVEEETATKSEIILLDGDDEKVKDALMESYKAAVAAENVKESFYELPGQDLGAFFEKMGFKNDVIEGGTVSITLEEFMQLPIIKGKIPEHIGSISGLVMRAFRKGVTKFLFMGKKGLLEDLAYLPINWFEMEVSAYSAADEKVNGFLLLRKNPSGSLEVKLFIAAGPDYLVNLVGMVRYAVKKAYELYPPETKIIIRRHNDQTHAFVGKLFPGAKGEPSIRGGRDEV